VSAWRIRLLLAASCGRLGFDPTAGDTPRDAVVIDARICLAPVGHDEDADGVDDACDGCPHISDPSQPDIDGDRVNDACDPRPDIAGETIGLFASFAAADSRFTKNAATPTYTDDDLVVLQASGGRVAMHTPRLAMPATYILGGVIMADGAGDAQLTIGADNAVDARKYYCEIEENTASVKFAMTYTFDGASYDFAERSDGPPFATGEFRLSLSDAYPQLECATTWNVPEQRLVKTIPSGLDATRVGFSIVDVDARVHYFVAIVHGN
jgi:hypothetical protein